MATTSDGVAEARTQAEFRRRVLCIRPRNNPQASAILNTVSDEWVEALRLHADVTVVNQDLDLRAICDRHRPDLIVVEAFEWGRPGQLAISGPRSHPEIPRVLFLNSDPHDPMRTVTMRVVEELGVEAVFVANEAYRQHMPELRHRPLYFASAFFDDDIYKDHGEEKSIPLSVFGGYLAPDFYPWRIGTLDAARDAMPTLIYKHPGYVKGQVDPFAVRDEPYARLLNRCFFSAADTTRLDYLVRKHLEIPASGCVLVAPDSEALKAYGFKDLENCILGDGPALFDKIQAVAADPSRYERIRRAGLALVHERYTRKRWTPFLDWLECRLSLRPGETVQQCAPFGSFRAVAGGPATPSVLGEPLADNPMTAALRGARRAILTGIDLPDAERRLDEAARWLSHLAESYFLLGVIALLKGNPTEAAWAIERRARGLAGQDAALALLDPVELAWLLLIAHLLGETAIEQTLLASASGMDHISVRRTLWLLAGGGQSGEAIPADLLERRETDRLSVHWLGNEDFPLWCDLVRRVVAANSAQLRPPVVDSGALRLDHLDQAHIRH